MFPRATIDFETRSACELRTCGTWKYAIDPSTEVLCLAFRLPHWETGRTALWHQHPGIPETPNMWLDFAELLEWIYDGKFLEAHNAWFEQCIWAHIMVPMWGCEPVPQKQWICSAAKAAAHALPRALDDALAALGLGIRKDAVGAKVMKKMTKPRKPRKAERERWALLHGSTPHPRVYFDTPELFGQLCAYCRQDVLAEEALSHALPDLSEPEQELYWLDQAINRRGFQLDTKAVQFALGAIKRETVKLNQDVVRLTEGRITKVTQRGKLLAWLNEDLGCDTPDTQKETVSWLLEKKSLSPEAREVLEILQALSRSSTAKYTAMQAQAASDGRVRGGLLFHGASTGRWTGAGVQPHNFPKAVFDKLHPLYDQEVLWAHVLAKKPLDQPMATFSHGLRGVITATPGYQLYVADYSAIEARVLPWLAEDEETLDLFRTGADLYCDFASNIYNRPITQADTKERTLGKIGILGLGYQMGWEKFIATAATYKLTISEELSQDTVNAYRERFWRIKELWAKQEYAAIEALQTGDTIFEGHIIWFVEGEFLYAELPSGRRLAYPFPELRENYTPWGERKKQLTYMGINSYSRKWTRQPSYGGMLVENLTQAVARDVMAEALTRCEQSGVYLPVLSVHDELIAEAPAGVGTVSAFKKLLTDAPWWAPDLPIAAEGWKGFRYHK